MRRLRGTELRMIFQNPDDQPEPGLADRRPDHRGPARVRRHVVAAGARARHRTAGPRRHPQPRAALRRVSLPMVGRHAAAGGHRHGHGRLAEAAVRRRADDGAGRHHPGPDPGAAAGAAGAQRHDAGAGVPRSGRRRGDLRPHCRHVCRPHRRDGADEVDLRCAAPSLYRRPAELDPAFVGRREPADTDPRPAAGSGAAGAGLPLRAALQLCLGGLQHIGDPLDRGRRRII